MNPIMNATDKADIVQPEQIAVHYPHIHGSADYQPRILKWRLAMLRHQVMLSTISMGRIWITSDGPLCPTLAGETK